MRSAACVPLLALAVMAGGAHARRGPETDVTTTRLRITLNDGWRYAPGPVGSAADPAFDDTGWERINLPHTWNAVDALDESGTYRRGEGWYRRGLDPDPALRGRRLFLYFEGANQVAEVFVNGESVGTHAGGYTAFVFDVTEQVRFDGSNVIAVRVDNAHDPDIPPLNADFTFFGGLYRDVWLIATDPVHIDVEDHASPGVFVDTPEVSAERATVRVRGAVVNRTAGVRAVELTHHVYAPDGHEVTALRTQVRIAANGRATFEATGAVEQPALWSPESPAVYTVVTEVTDGGRVLDRVTVPLGFRWIRVDARSGFFLNGEHRSLHGTNRHQDRPGIGTALTDAQHRADIDRVKQTGFGFLRLAHYPQDPAVLDATDAAGLVVWEEIPVVNIIAVSEAFAANAERMLVEMVRQHYNHPSVLLRGYMNEVLLVRPEPEPAGYVEAVAALARRLEARARAEDPSRATVMAISFDEVDNGSGLHDIPQILGLNLYFGWYYRDLDALGPYLDSLRVKHPGRPLFISEYGAGSDERVHATEPVAFDFSVEHQRRFHETAFNQILARPWLVGSAVWNQFDFASAGRQDTKPGLNQKGLFFHDRTPKDVAFLYRARLSDDPVLHIAAHEWTRRAGSAPADAEGDIVAYTNLDSVELFQDGTSVGSVVAANGVVHWPIRLHPGRNRIEAVAGDVRDRVDIDYEDRTAFFAAASSDVREIAVNAGGAYTFVGDIVWEPDHAYEEHRGWGALGGRTVQTHHRMLGTADEPLWQAVRLGATGYRFDVPDGEYEVALGLVETEHDAAGTRVLDASVNGASVFRSLDLAATAGRWRPIERRVRVTASGGQGIRVDLKARSGETTIAAVRVRRL